MMLRRDDVNIDFILKPDIDPKLIKDANEWYERFTGKKYTSSDIKELVDIYQSLHEIL
jgi:hypothetical protein